MNISEELYKMQDTKYKAFHSQLMPTVNPENIIGVRVPALRNFAKNIKDSADGFLYDLPHTYYEENNLHAFLISEIKDFHKCIKMLNDFLPYVDNWATCDGIRPPCFKKNKKELLFEIEKWIKSEHTYTVRFAIEMLMVHFLDKDFDKNHLNVVSNVNSGEYYVKMMVAWYFATALAKQWESAVLYLEEHLLHKWVHNKTIQKAVESYRITSEQKEYLRSLKIK